MDRAVSFAVAPGKSFIILFLELAVGAVFLAVTLSDAMMLSNTASAPAIAPGFNLGVFFPPLCLTGSLDFLLIGIDVFVVLAGNQTVLCCCCIDCQKTSHTWGKHHATIACNKKLCHKPFKSACCFFPLNCMLHNGQFEAVVAQCSPQIMT